MLPSISAYKDALRTAAHSLSKLNYLEPVLDETGDLFFSSGNYAVVFKMKDIRDGSFKALKCFTREQDRRRESLFAISGYLDGLRCKYTVPYTYLDNEIWVDGSEYPILYMEWVEGITLGEYVTKLCIQRDIHALELLSRQFAELGLWLMDQDWAHGDIKHDNIIIRPNGELVLVDYDGCFVPSMAGQEAREGGSPGFRHPQRSSGKFDRHIDDYSILVIFLSLRMLCVVPELRQQQDTGENLVLKMGDLSNPATSVLLKNFRESADKQLKACIVLLEMALAVGAGKVYGLREVLRDFLPQVVNPKTQYRPEMIFVEGGNFMMGGDLNDDEKPIHEVKLDSYYIGKYPITQKEWREIMGNNPSGIYGYNQCPVEQVSWSDVQEFLQRLNVRTGQNYRLPTEAEWEFAARGGTKSKRYQYAGSNYLRDVAWYKDNSGDRTHPVGQKLPNELGLYDMSGNVWEWCQDWYGDYLSYAQINPKGPSNGSFRVVRGGSWYGGQRYCCVAYRTYGLSSLRRFDVGFRLAMSP